MDVSTLQRLDANILLGIINEKLRLECDGLEELLAYYDMTEDQLATRLQQIGYHYDQGEIVNILLKIKNSFLPTKQILIGL